MAIWARGIESSLDYGFWAGPVMGTLEPGDIGVSGRGGIYIFSFFGIHRATYVWSTCLGDSFFES